MSSHTLSAQIDVRIPLKDGGYLVADVYRPAEAGEYPVLIAVGPYGKDLPFHEFNPEVYAKVPRPSPYMVWETPDPAWWVPRGYVVVRADMRGMRKSPGLLTLHTKAEIDDYCDAIEWAGTQAWSNGKVGMSGVSYFAFTQWQVAARNPPHLAAIVPWEGFSDFYREEQRHGGIFSNGFVEDRWYALRILQGQNGQGLAGEPLLDDAERARNRACELPEQVRRHELLDDTYTAMNAVLENIEVPLYSSGNWGGMGLHLRGCVEGYQRVASRHKWLEMHSGNFVYSYYGEEGLETQLRFFRLLAQGHRQRPADDKASQAGDSQRRRQFISLALGKRVADRADGVDAALSRCKRHGAAGASVRGRSQRVLHRKNRRCALSLRALRRRNRNHRPDESKGVDLVINRRRRHLYRRAAI